MLALSETQKSISSALRSIKMNGMADEYEAQQLNAQLFADKTFDYRIDKLVQSQKEYSANRHVANLIKSAKFRDGRELSELKPDGVKSETLAEVASKSWLAKGINLVILGPCGVGKSSLGCALGRNWCRQEAGVLYFSTSSLVNQVLSLDFKSRQRLLARLTSIPALIMDDFGVNDLPQGAPDVFYEIFDARYSKACTVVISQIKISSFRALLGGDSRAEGIVDRISNPSVVMELKGESKRKLKGTPVSGSEEESKKSA